MLLIILIIIFFIYFRFIPLQDYPDWLFQSLIFKEIITGNTKFASYYEFNSFLTPNIISTIIVGFLSLILNPIVAGKLFLIISVELLFISIFIFLRAHSTIQYLPAIFISFLIIWNKNLFLGNINFIFGLGISFLLLSLLKKKESTNNLIYFFFLLVIYYSHFLCWFISVYFIIVYSIILKKYSLLTRTLLMLSVFVIIFLFYIVSLDFSHVSLYLVEDISQILLKKPILFISYFNIFPLFDGVNSPSTILYVLNWSAVIIFCFLFLRAIF